METYSIEIQIKDVQAESYLFDSLRFWKEKECSITEIQETRLD